MVRYATRDDLIAWFGEVPATMRAIVVEHDGAIQCVAGIARAGDHLQAFSSFTELMRSHRYVLAKVAMKFKEMLKDYGTVFAICSDVEPTAPDLLSKVGFVHVQERLWRHG